MKQKLINATHISGYLYDHKLEERVSGENSKTPGVNYITGTVDLATNLEATNVVQVHYTYQVPVTTNGKVNNTYSVLKDILNGKYNTVMKDGIEKAAKFRIDSAIGLNEFYSNRTGTLELVSAKRNEGGFIHPVDTLEDEPENARSTFDVDIVITRVTHVEGDPEKNTSDSAVVHGCIFSFRKEMLPVEFVAHNEGAIQYFEGLDASSKNPVFTRIKGRQMSQVLTREIREESAFGDDSVRVVKSSRKEWVITWAAKEPYEFNSENTILASELTKAMQDRELYLATVKQRAVDYQESKNSAINVSAGTVTDDDFKF